MTPPRHFSAAPNCESDPSSSLQAPKFFRVLVLALAFVGASFSLSFAASLVTATPASAVITGIDVASYQHPNGAPINWQQVAGAGHKFAYVKASEGPLNNVGDCAFPYDGYRPSSYRNPYFAGDWDGAASAGLYRGAYHFARPQFPLSSAEEQARYFVSIVGSSTGGLDLPMELDLEVTCGLGQADLAEWARRFLAEVTRMTGKRPLVYTGRWFWQGNIGSYGNDIGQNYRLWTADYPCQRNDGYLFCDPNTSTYNPPTYGGWGQWTFWQNYSVGVVPGIRGNVDMNRFCCDLSSLQALAGAGSGGGSPFGSFDGTALNSANNIHVAGWAIDPDTTAPIQVHFYTDGAWTGATTADGIRTDVGAVYPGFGSAHGFSADFAIPTGAQRMCAYGINVSSGLNLPLGCLSLGGAPQGWLDSAVLTRPGKVRVSGWAADPNDWSRSTVVHVYAGTAWTSLPANQPRTDVNNFFGITGNHGFNAEIDASGGPIQVCAYGINDTGPGGPSLLSCKSVTVPTGSPYGSLDVVKARPGAIDIAGWVIDPDTANPTQVHVYVDGVGVAIVASAPRPDVAAAFPLYGANHGFSTSIPVSAGSHQVCVYSINTVGAGSNQTLGCRTVVSRNGDPFGSIDWAASGFGHIGVAGWALDPNTDDPIVIHIYVNGVGVGRLASDYRADVAAAFGNGPNHGFTYVVPRPSADPQTICVFGLNVGAGTNSLIGCRVV